MLKKLKLGLTLVKYGFRPGTNIAMCILFCIIGLAVEIASKGTNIIGAFYLMLTAMFAYQMIISMDVSTFVQTSKMKKALQTTVPALTSTILYLIVFTIIVIEKIFIINAYPETKNEVLGASVLLVVLLFGAMIYTGFCYKYFIGGTIFYLVYVSVAMFVIESWLEEGKIIPTLPGIIIAGYITIILGGIAEYLLSCALYSKELSKFAFKGIFGKLQ